MRRVTNRPAFWGFAPVRSAVVLLAAFLSVPLVAQETAAGPLTKQRLLETLELVKGPAADSLIAQIEQRGVDFQMTAADERELKAAGASKKLLAAIRKSARVQGPAPGGAGQSAPPQIATAPVQTTVPTLPGAGAPASPGAGVQGQTTPHVSPTQRALVVFYGTCPKGALTIYKATIAADGRALARLACDSYFYTVAAPGMYTFCVNGKQCQTPELHPGLSYFFKVPARMIGYGLDPVLPQIGENDIRALSPLESKRFLAPDLVSADMNRAPASVLTPNGPKQKGGRR